MCVRAICARVCACDVCVMCVMCVAICVSMMPKSASLCVRTHVSTCVFALMCDLCVSVACAMIAYVSY